MSDDTPTQRFDAPLTPSGATTTPTPPDERKKTSRGVIIALIAVGAILLIALIVLLALLLHGNGTPTAAVTPSASAMESSVPTPTSTATVSASPSPTPTPTPTKSSGSSGGGGGGAATGPSIGSFTASPTTVACPAADAAVKNPTLVQFRWSTSNVDSVEFGLIGADGNYQTQDTNLPPQGTNDSDLPGSEGGWAYPCGTHSVTYVLKATGGGQTKTAKVVVTDVTY